jgi:hypothetical protein
MALGKAAIGERQEISAQEKRLIQDQWLPSIGAG